MAAVEKAEDKVEDKTEDGDAVKAEEKTEPPKVEEAEKKVEETPEKAKTVETAELPNAEDDGTDYGTDDDAAMVEAAMEAEAAHLVSSQVEKTE